MQKEAGSRYYVGNALTAAYVYCATFVALFAPLPQEQCAMEAGSRSALNTLDAATAAALDPMLLEHRDMMDRERLVLPLLWLRSKASWPARSPSPSAAS